MKTVLINEYTELMSWRHRASGNTGKQLREMIDLSLSEYKQPSDDDLKEKIDEHDIEFINIRTNSRDETIQKSTCSAQITSSKGIVRDYNYVAQETEDGNLFVEGSF